MTPAKKSTTFEYEGVTYDVYDWRWGQDRKRKRVDLNSRHATGRAFVPRDPTKDIRVYDYAGMTVESSEAAILAEQFRFSVPARRLW